MREASNAEVLYRERKRRREELEHAKRVSDQIGALIGLPDVVGHPASYLDFPGLAEARRLEDEALAAWSKERRTQ